MIEIRTHGRGGQGSVIASEILADAFFHEGKFVQAFPAFGVERRGAPVMAFTRVSDSEVRERCQIYEPDHLIVLDPVLIETVNITEGLKEGGWIIINTNKPVENSNLTSRFHVAIVDANRIALDHGLGSRSAPIVNTSIVGAFAGATKLVGIEAVKKAIDGFVPLKKEHNIQAAVDAYNGVQIVS
ncbi:MAG: pyruvate ferredoxin oxidoreductase subunit gamma [Candidatus Krumholzibacteria bacterium]|jgi:2-oxoacid:acceptor oxidoreductase gamma subunit (pyruvate/2-ketoisovalerate family)|nr:pyruvate ferredoxin oxidoreductase subunit gamma [Candidatus Krumholzibacteria bacterium]